MQSYHLLWSYYLPDHTIKAKQIIKAEWIRRNHSPADIDAWIPAAKDLTVPRSFSSLLSEKNYRLVVRYEPVLFLICFRVLLPLYYITLLMGALEAIKESAWQSQIAFLKSQWFAHLIYWTHATNINLFVALLVLSVSASNLFRRRALRILLLRPFGDKTMTRP
jgi:hypothetical protein